MPMFDFLMSQTIRNLDASKVAVESVRLRAAERCQSQHVGIVGPEDGFFVGSVPRAARRPSRKASAKHDFAAMHFLLSQVDTG